MADRFRRNFKLKVGDRIRLDSHDKLFNWMMAIGGKGPTEPDWVEVVKVYEDFIQVKAHYEVWGYETEYTTAINKWELVTGDTTFKRLEE